jgi:hypothetical protein
MRQAITSEPAVLPLLDRFVAVEIQDSTTIALPENCAERFRGCGGSRTHSAAALKAQFRWELRSGRLDGPLLQDGRASDRALDFRERAIAGTLRIRDLGYWHLDDLVQDDRDGRFWVSRLKPGTAITTLDGQRQELVALLAVQPDEQVDLLVRLGARHQHQVRLLARRVAADVAAARERQAERTARRKGREVSASTRALCSWEVLVTNVAASRLSAAEAWILLGVRWQIEIVFTQMTKGGGFPRRTGWQDIPNLNLVVCDDDTIDKQFDQLPSLGEIQAVQGRLDALAECSHSFGQFGHIDLALRLGIQLAQLLGQPIVCLLHLLPFTLEFVAANNFGQVGIQQPRLLAVELGEGILERLPARA